MKVDIMEHNSQDTKV